MNFWQWLRVVLLGVIEGVTEWLPVSSTGHLQFFGRIWPGSETVFTPAFTSLFDVIIQLGAILAVIVTFFHKLNPISSYKTKEQKRDTWMLWLKIAISSVPAAVVGLILDDWIDERLGSPFILAAMLILYGIVFIIVEIARRGKDPTVVRLQDITIRTAVIIGLAQVLALVPGTSRSGVTIIAALLLGLSRSIAAEYTFFLAIPVMAGASLLRFVKYVFIDQVSISGAQWGALIVASLVAFGVSMLVIRTFMKFIKRHDFTGFGAYRIAFGVLIILVTALFFR